MLQYCYLLLRVPLVTVEHLVYLAPRERLVTWAVVENLVCQVPGYEEPHSFSPVLFGNINIQALSHNDRGLTSAGSDGHSWSPRSWGQARTACKFNGAKLIRTSAIKASVLWVKVNTLHWIMQCLELNEMKHTLRIHLAISIHEAFLSLRARPERMADLGLLAPSGTEDLLEPWDCQDPKASM